MSRKTFEKLIYEKYGISPDYPWANTADHGVFRHKTNSKWFAVEMTIPRSKLKIDGDGYIEVVNVKCPVDLVQSLWQERGIYPAYHMNRAHWLSVLLDGSVSDETLEWLVGISFELTKEKRRQVLE